MVTLPGCDPKVCESQIKASAYSRVPETTLRYGLRRMYPKVYTAPNGAIFSFVGPVSAVPYAHTRSCAHTRVSVACPRWILPREFESLRCAGDKLGISPKVISAGLARTSLRGGKEYIHLPTGYVFTVVK